MSYALILATLAGVHLVAAISPGPAFVAVTRVAVAGPRRVAVATALGIASASMVWVIAALLGMHVLLRSVGWLYSGLQLAGGAYLVWLGIQGWRHAAMPLDAATPAMERMSARRAWRLGVAVNLANPKAMIFFGSILITFLTPDMPGWLVSAALLVIAVNETAWFVLVALLFSSAPTQSAYRRAKGWIDRVMGGVLIAFGLRLVLGSRG